MGNIDYKYNPIDAAWYAAYAPILWCFSFAWIIFTSQLGYKGTYTNYTKKHTIFILFLGTMSKFLAWKGFLIWTKISYTVYLTQFPIFFYNVGKVRNADYFGVLPMLVSDVTCLITRLYTVVSVQFWGIWVHNIVFRCDDAPFWIAVSKSEKRYVWTKKDKFGGERSTGENDVIDGCNF